jgi:hypothetical protein
LWYFILLVAVVVIHQEGAVLVYVTDDTRVKLAEALEVAFDAVAYFE